MEKLDYPEINVEMLDDDRSRDMDNHQHMIYLARVFTDIDIYYFDDRYLVDSASIYFEMCSYFNDNYKNLDEIMEHYTSDNDGYMIDSWTSFLEADKDMIRDEDWNLFVETLDDLIPVFRSTIIYFAKERLKEFNEELDDISE